MLGSTIDGSRRLRAFGVGGGSGVRRECSDSAGSSARVGFPDPLTEIAFSQCTLCRRCTVNCPLGVDTPLMMRAIRDYRQQTGFQVGFKPAGGIRAAKEALQWLALLKEELGDEWMTPRLFRFGASSLLDDITRQLSHAATGRYAAEHHIPMG